jgi:hypothetical protein
MRQQPDFGNPTAENQLTGRMQQLQPAERENAGAVNYIRSLGKNSFGCCLFIS